MRAEQKEAAAENLKVFGVEKVENFTSMRTPEGDKIVCLAHQAARKAIRELCPHIQVGLTLSLHDIQALPGGEAAAAKEWDEEFTHYLPYIKDDDFLGVQNYTRSLTGPEGQVPAPEDAELTQMNYEFSGRPDRHGKRHCHRRRYPAYCFYRRSSGRCPALYPGRSAGAGIFPLEPDGQL